MTGESGYIPDMFDAVTGERASIPGNATEALALLDQWVERDWIRALDHAFAAFVCNMVREQGNSRRPCWRCWQPWFRIRWGVGMCASI